MKLKVVDLFAGTGCISYCFEQYDEFECVFANDFSPNSKIIYDDNHKNVSLTLGDLNKIDPADIPEHDILTAGFNCQPYSVSGKRKGFNDERSKSFFHTIKILKHHNTPIVIFENVKNLVNHDGGKTMKKIKELLDDMNYHFKYKVLNTCQVTDIPQNRERVFIICFKDKTLFDKFEFEFETKTNKKIKEFLEEKVADKYFYSERYKVYDIVKNGITRDIEENVMYQLRRKYVRENKSNVCPTLTKNMGLGGHNVPLMMIDDKIRKLTPRECFNLQGFPKDFLLSEKISDSGLYQLAGNAITLKVINLIILQLRDILFE